VSPGFRRAIVLNDIAARMKPAGVAFAAPADFDLIPVRFIEGLDGACLGADAKALIYCFDAAAERALFTLCDDMPRILQAPFLYEAQFLQARQVVSVPFERLEGLFDLPEARPTFVFSIGRCGSTLLSALLAAAGRQSVSEPDVLTQLAELPAAARATLSPGAPALLVRACVASLQTHCGADVVIKLRSQCSRIATEIVSACPAARIIFMLRGRHAWARSRHRAFDETPGFLAELLAWSVERYNDLVATGRDVQLVWYEDLLAAPCDTLRRIGALGDDAECQLADRVDAVMARDVQHGSHLSQCTLPDSEMPAEALVAFDRHWADVRPDRLIARYGLERLI
jgi:hypothetical protein